LNQVDETSNTETGGPADPIFEARPPDLSKFEAMVIIRESLPLFLWPEDGCSQGTVARNTLLAQDCD
jgi:hypothetical protein